VFRVGCRYFRPSAIETPLLRRPREKKIRDIRQTSAHSFPAFDNVRLRLYFFEYEYSAVSGNVT